MKRRAKIDIDRLEPAIRIILIRGGEALELPPEEIYILLHDYFYATSSGMLYGWKEIARHARVSPYTARNWAAKYPEFRDMVHHTRTGMVYMAREDLEKWLLSCTRRDK